MQNSRLILASASPRRKELLERSGVKFDVIPALIDESLAGEDDVYAVVAQLTKRKGDCVAQRHPERFVLSADTLVALVERFQGKGEPSYEVLGKPQDEEHARTMLEKLSGREHLVLTGFSLQCVSKGYSVADVVTTKVFFRRLGAEEIAAYIGTGEPLDKAGAYAIQGHASVFVEKIEGSYTNVVGLPLVEVLEELKACGLWTADLLNE